MESGEWGPRRESSCVLWNQRMPVPLLFWFLSLLFLLSSSPEGAFSYGCSLNQRCFRTLPNNTWVWGYILQNGKRTFCCKHRPFVLGFSSSHFNKPSVCRSPVCLRMRIITLVDICENVCDIVFRVQGEQCLSWLAFLSQGFDLPSLVSSFLLLLALQTRLNNSSPLRCLHSPSVSGRLSYVVPDIT